MSFSKWVKQTTPVSQTTSNRRSLVEEVFKTISPEELESLDLQVHSADVESSYSFSDPVAELVSKMEEIVEQYRWDMDELDIGLADRDLIKLTSLLSSYASYVDNIEGQVVNLENSMKAFEAKAMLYVRRKTEKEGMSVTKDVIDATALELIDDKRQELNYLRSVARTLKGYYYGIMRFTDKLDAAIGRASYERTQAKRLG